MVSQVPGDGRELVATDPSAVKVRAEDGRNVEGVDISPFINNLPFGSAFLASHPLAFVAWLGASDCGNCCTRDQRKDVEYLTA